MKKRLLHLLMILCAALALCVTASAAVRQVSTDAQLRTAAADASVSEIRLAANISLESTLEIKRTLTLDLNGHYLEPKSGGQFRVIKLGSDELIILTVKDSKSNTSNAGAIRNGADATGEGGGGVYVGPGATLIMEGSEIRSCKAKSGGGVYLASYAKLEMCGSSRIYSCSAVSDNSNAHGGGVYVGYDSSVLMTDNSSIASCSAEAGDDGDYCYGGGVYVDATGELTMEKSSSINNCKAAAKSYVAGGGVYARGSSSFIMSGGDIGGCTATGDSFVSGGGVYAGGSFRMTGGTIADSCTSTGNSYAYGDGLYIEDDRMNADGGTAECAVYIYNGEIGCSEDAAGSTTFTGNVSNAGTISGGTFEGWVTNSGDSGYICGGTFGENSGVSTVSFDAAGGTPVTKKCYTITGSPISSYDYLGGKLDSSREGYDFDGWYYGGRKWNVRTDVVTENMTLTARWISHSAVFTVTFDANGGAFMVGGDSYERKSFNVRYNTCVAEPDPAPVRFGYTLAEWRDKDGRKWDFEKDVVKGNMTLYAAWTPAVYTVEFDSAGGTDIAAQEGIEHNAHVTEPEDPTKEGAVFDGWYYNGKHWNFRCDPVTGGMTLVAHWVGGAQTIPVTGVSLDMKKLSLEKSENTSLTAIVAPADADDRRVSWESTDTSVAAVDAGGNVTAKGAGMAMIVVRTADGNRIDTCTVTVTDASAPAPELSHTHSYSETWDKDAAHHWRVCTGCTVTTGFNTHDYGSWNVTRQPTAAETGERERSCTTCGYIERQTIPAIGGSPEPGHTHSYGETWDKDAAHHWRVCTGCTVTTEFNTHDYGSWSVTRQPTATETGERERSCTTCGYVERQTIPAIGGSPEPSHTHSYSETWDKDAMHHWRVCADADCPDPEASVRDKAEHGYSSDADATCNTCGYKRTVLPAPAPVTPAAPVTPPVPQPPKAEDEGKREDTTDGSDFTDVDKNDWFDEDVRYVSEKKLMNGVSGTEFAPDAAVTRGMVVTILARMEGVSTGGTPWYAAGRAWAMENGISDGTSMEAPITREQLAAMLFRYAVFKGMDAVTLADHLAQFSDRGQISTWAVSALNWAVGSGIMNGRSGGALDPKGTAARAELAAMLRRFLEQ